MAPCSDCGRTFDPVCMDFDHVPGRGPKVKSVSRQWNDIEALKAEITKCDVVCACCHRLRTSQRGMSAEARAKINRSAISEASRRQWQDPEVRARRVAGLRRSSQDPVRRAKYSRPRGPMPEATKAKISASRRAGSAAQKTAQDPVGD